MATTTTTTETTATTKITKTETCTETMYTAAFTTVNTDGAPVKRYNIGTNYTYGTHTYSIVGVRKYTGDAHSYWLVKFDSDPTTHELTADKIKDYIGDDRKQIRNGSANDTENGTAQKSKRTANETAAQIRTKYADTIKAVRDKVGKLQADDRILGALNLLCTMIETVASERIDTITNAEKAKRAARLERVSYLSSVLPKLQLDAVAAMQNGDFDRAVSLSKDAKEMQAELILLQAEEAAYNASIASEETAEDSEESEQPAE